MTGWTILTFVAASYALAITVSLVIVVAFGVPGDAAAAFAIINGTLLAIATVAMEGGR